MTTTTSSLGELVRDRGKGLAEAIHKATGISYGEAEKLIDSFIVATAWLYKHQGPAGVLAVLHGALDEVHMSHPTSVPTWVHALEHHRREESEALAVERMEREKLEQRVNEVAAGNDKRLAPIEKQIRALTALEKRLREMPPEEELAAGADDVEVRLCALKLQLRDFEARLEDMAETAVSGSAHRALARAVGVLECRIDTIDQRQQAIDRDLSESGLESRLDGFESDIRHLQSFELDDRLTKLEAK